MDKKGKLRELTAQINKEFPEEHFLCTYLALSKSCIE